MSLIHGDSTTLDWEDLLPRPVDCIITDPPFGVNYQSRRGKTERAAELSIPIANDGQVDTAIECFNDAVTPLAELAADECEMYVFTRWDVISEWIAALCSFEPHGFKYKAMLVWDKGALGMGDIDASWGASYELILYAKKGRRDLNYQRSSVLSFDKVATSSRIHPTEKPVALLEELVSVSTGPGDLVVDPFAGSAATLAAAENLGRSAFGAEMNDSYYTNAQKRLASQVLF